MAAMACSFALGCSSGVESGGSGTVSGPGDAATDGGGGADGASDAGTDVATDVGTDTNGSPFGPAGCALEVPGPGALASVTETDGLFGEEFSVELWVNFEALSDALEPPPQYVMIAENSETDTAFYVHATYNEVGCSIRDFFVWSTAALTVASGYASDWHHVLCVRSAEGLQLWLDGLWNAGSPGAPAYEHDGSAIIFGAGLPGPSVPVQDNAFRGLIDEVAIHDAALASVTFNDDNTFDADAFEPSASVAISDATVAAWHFDECEGAAAADATGGMRSAELAGDAGWVP